MSVVIPVLISQLADLAFCCMLHLMGLGHQDHGWQQLLSTFRQQAAMAASRKLVLDVELPTVWLTPDTWWMIGVEHDMV